MPAKLIARSTEREDERLEFSIGAEARIGRGKRNDIVLEFNGVSVEHSRIFFDPKAGCYVLEDLGSLNGTELDGQRIEEPERLGHLHVITFAAELDFVFEDLDKIARRQGRVEEAVSRPAAAEGAKAPARRAPTAASGEGTRFESEPIGVPAALAGGTPPAKTAAPADADGTRIEKEAVGLPPGLAKPPTGVRRAVAASGPTAYLLEVATEAGTPRRFELQSGVNVVGRTRRAEIRIERPEISRRHAIVTVWPDRVTVRDLGTRNRTFVDGERIGEEEVELKPGGSVSFAGVEARLFARSPGPRE